MKKLMLILCSVMLVLGTVGGANAVPTTWTDHIDFEPDVDIPPTHSYYHDIGDGENGFSSWLMGGDDTIDSFSLQLGVYDDNVGHTTRELVFVDWNLVWQETQHPDGDETGYVSFGLESQEIAFGNDSASYAGDLWGGLDIYHDGTLNVSVSATDGDFYLGSSTLTVNGDDGTAPVPEPSTIMLMGVGLLGLVGFSRRRFKKS